MKAAEVRRSEDGVWHLSILTVLGEDGETRGVKTPGSRRNVPLHPDLLKLGFDRYAAALPKGSALFPLLKADRSGYFGTNFGKRWAVYLRDVVGLHSEASPVHGFRHTFKTMCREVEIDEELHDAITGHAGKGGVGRIYGSMPLDRVSREIAKIPSAPLSALK